MSKPHSIQEVLEVLKPLDLLLPQKDPASDVFEARDCH